VRNNGNVCTPRTRRKAPDGNRPVSSIFDLKTDREERFVEDVKFNGVK